MKHGLKVQISDYDSYQETSSSLDQLSSQVSRVPIIRVYGSISIPIESNSDTHATSSSSVDQTSTHSHNILLHVHNYYPYLYVDCIEEKPDVIKLIQQLESCLRNNVGKRKRRKKVDDDDDHFESESEDGDGDGDDDDTCGRRKYIANVSICKGTPIYGFHVGYKPVYKISLLSPSYKTTLFRLIDEGIIPFGPRKQKRNVYESHIPYLLQFLVDFNLFGCSWMNISNCYWRTPILNKTYKSMDLDPLREYLSTRVHKKNVLSTLKYPRIGNSILEADIITDSILNRDLLSQQHLHDKLNVLESPEISSQVKNLSSLDHLFKDLAYQCKIRGSNLSLGSQIKTDVGLSTKWSNQQELDELLEYVTTRGTTGSKKHLETAEDYNVKYFENDIKYPTTFESIDIEKGMMSSGGIYSIERDLEKWEEFKEIEWDENDMVRNEESTKDELDNVVEKSEKVVEGVNDIGVEELQEDEEEGKAENKVSDNSKSIQRVDNEFESIIFSDSEEAGEVETQSSPIIEGDASLSDEPDHEFTVSQMDQDFLMEITQRPKRTHSDAFENLSECEASTPNTTLEPLSSNTFISIPPTEIRKQNIMKSFEMNGVLKVEYQDPHYDNEKDLPTKAFIFANKKISVPCITNESAPQVIIDNQSISKSVKETINNTAVRRTLFKSKIVNERESSWIYRRQPPSKQSILQWIKAEPKRKQKSEQKSQLERYTASNDFKFSYQSQKTTRKPDGYNFLTSFNLEIQTYTRSTSLPDPKKDAINMIFYHFDDPNRMYDSSEIKEKKRGTLVYLEPSVDHLSLTMEKFPNVEVFYCEKEMIIKLQGLVRYFDPDILCGYEINAASWGYIIERFRYEYDINLCFELSRCTYKSNGKVGDRWGYTHTSNIKISGRHMLNIWRTLRSELSLTNYSIENVAYHLLHQTVPRYSQLQLSSWFHSDNQPLMYSVINYFNNRLDISSKLLQVQETIPRNAEQSRLIGVDFYSNFYRGSQYKVESILCRLAKKENFLLNSPSKQQVHDMRSLECIPLVMEPESNFYKSPLIVLDFQSLYPSVMIAYNYCYSTLIGKLKGFDPSKRNGVGYLKHLPLPPGLVNLLQEDINVSPNGYMFVNSKVRKSVLAKMLEEILDIRINVKSVMKMFGNEDPELMKLYNSRQLALKLIANVTYGYTSATFSGRMPNSDISDAIVSTGRELLTQSIDIIESFTEWGAKVVYGDTDSLFVYLPGKTKEDAFTIGREMAEKITNMFPNPIKLKFEKVYHPCLLLSKKRYVGYSYEYESQKVPKFDAKGIETIRRDGIPAQQIIMERSLRMLFETQNLSLIKKYVMDQFHKVMINKVPVMDFCFAKEVRHGTYKNEKYLPPGAVLAKQKVSNDARSEPQYRERVPYLVIQDSHKQRIKDRCVSPEDFVASFQEDNQTYKLDDTYYITRVLIPPLERVFNLIGVDVKSWYKELPQIAYGMRDSSKAALGKFVRSYSCIRCSKKLNLKISEYLCSECLQDEIQTVSQLKYTIQENERDKIRVNSACKTCVNRGCGPLGSAIEEFSQRCENFNCKVYFEKLKVNNEKRKISLRNLKILEDW
ncbi:DNA polymerase zeta catalytic subunit [[Candida] anglica]|uniref:DNA polymerase n=1 Tax=[Candida] anglica TaxID=148631 RepID=A0ABP0EN84_9ASCO